MAPPSGGTTSVQVAVRIRPTTSHDTISIPARFQRTVVQAASPTSVQVDATTSAPNTTISGGSQAPASSAGPTKKQLFTFDQVHPPSTSQHTLFHSTAEPLLSRFLQGFNCTILAYGQTSSGKTYSMTGVDLDADPSDSNNGMGIIPRAVSKIFEQARQLKQERGSSWSYSIKGSFIEIYNEDLIDLLGDETVKREVQIREDKDGHIIWGGLREVSVRNSAEVMGLIRQGTAIRRTNETDMNAQSSRSHAIFSLTLTQKKYTGSDQPTRSSSPLPPSGRSPSRLARPGSTYNSTGSIPRVNSPTSGRPPTPSFHNAMNRGGGLRPGSALGGRISPAPGKDDDDIGEWVTIVSKFHFVDLAGSERLKRTAAQGERIREGISINSGLLALGNVISALGDPSRAKSHTNSHIPYRDSKLTRLLQDSLGGNANTVMIACISPAEWNVGESINTLKYANRARNIRNRAVINEKEDGWDDIEWLQNMVTKLRKEFKSLKEGNPNMGIVAMSDDRENDGTHRAVLEQFVNLQSQHDDLRQQFLQKTEELAKLRGELGESQRATGGNIPGTGKYEEIVGPVIEEYEKTIASMEAELSLNRAALRHTNNLVTEKEEEFAVISERHAATESYLEELRSRVVKLTEREASTEAYVRDLEEKIKAYDEKNTSSSSIVVDLRRELQQFKERELHSTEYIADLEQRLSRSDESILSLRERVQQLENEVELRVEAAELLQKRLDEFTTDGQAWRNDLEEREAKVKQLERQMEIWEEKKRVVAEERNRLDDVVEDVVKARQNLEVDMQNAEGEQSLREQLSVLQETHQATLSDLAAVTDKYRDALREISDLAAQIQEAKLQASTGRESSDDGFDRSVPRTPRRRLTTAGSLRPARSGEVLVSPTGSGRRSFFRQAASTESLHARSLSQSQSLSQELSSARSHRPSSNSRPDSLSIPSPTLLSPVIPRTAPPANDYSERSAASLEKEIMRLQEVLKEREAEISSLEQSLKEKEKVENVLIKDIGPIPENEDQETELQDPTLKDLSPTTLKQFKDLRRLSRRLSLQKPAEPTPDPSETLDRLNELMLSMAQKESQHREVVEKLNTELSQVRRQYDELNALSRDQAVNMSAEIEALRREHVTTASELEELQLKYAEVSTELENQLVSQANLKDALADLRQREIDLLAQLEEEQSSYKRELDHLRSEHDTAICAKDVELKNSLAGVWENHESEIAQLKREVAETAKLLVKVQQEHEDTLGHLRAEHASQLEQRSREIEAFLGQSQTEQANTLSRLRGEYTQALKKEVEDNQVRIQGLQRAHEVVLNELRSEHHEALTKQETNALQKLEYLEREHAKSLVALRTMNDDTLLEAHTKHATAVQVLKDQHAAATQEHLDFHEEIIAKVKSEHENAVCDLLNTQESLLRNAELEHTSTLSRVREELALELAKLQGDISRAQGDQETLVSRHVDELAAARETSQMEHAQAVRELEEKHQRDLDAKAAAYESSLSVLKASYESNYSTLKESHADSNSRLVSEHEHVITAIQSKLASVQEEHRQELENLQKSYKSVLSDIEEKHVVTIVELQSRHESEREQLLKDQEVLVQEAAAYKSAMDEFTIGRQQTQEAHEEIILKKDLLIAALEEELATSKTQRSGLLSEVDKLKAELQFTRAQTNELVQEASKRDSLVQDLERHRSLLGEVQNNLQKTKDERDNLAADKNRQEELLRQLQAQLESQIISRNADVVATPRPVLEHRSGSLTRSNGIPPPMTPPPAGPPPPTPGQAARVAAESATARSSAAMSASSSSRGSHADVSTPATSISAQPNGHGVPDPKILARIEEQTLLLEEKEAMIKTLNKQLTHCEGDLQAHMDLVSTLENQLNDSERNLRKARLQATELSKERDRLNNQVETLRNELQEAKREVANVRRSIVQETQSLEHRLDEERKAKERARAQLDSRMEELQKRKSKFACM